MANDFLDKEEKLPENVKAYFRSNEVRFDLEKSCFLYGVNSELIAEISGPVGLIFVGDLKLANLPELISGKLNIGEDKSFALAWEINKRMFNRFPEYFKDAPDLLTQWESKKATPIMTEDEAWRKVLELEPWILEAEKEKAEEEREARNQVRYSQAQSIKIGINDALKKYPELGEQLVTSNHIKLKSFPDPVRPSIKNWISDYTFNTGYEKHNAMTLSNYLFQNENAHSLSQIDRQKLAYVLKAYDENGEVAVNEKTKQLIFPAPQAVRSAVPPIQPSAPSTTPRNFPVRPIPQQNISNRPTTFQNVYRPAVPQPQSSALDLKGTNRQASSVYRPPMPGPVRDQFQRENVNRFRQNMAADTAYAVPQAKISFSSPQKMPFESQNVPPKPPVRQPAPAVPSGPQPLVISSSRRKTVPDYNIVDLKK